MTGRVVYREWITREDMRLAPNESFVFGDNTERWGFAGQAKEMRGEPNAIGVATLWRPGKPYLAGEIEPLLYILTDLRKVGRALREGSVVNAPAQGLGTGLARMAENRPDLHDVIVAVFLTFPGQPCPWRMLANAGQSA